MEVILLLLEGMRLEQVMLQEEVLLAVVGISKD
jgi:hypothetical protein